MMQYKRVYFYSTSMVGKWLAFSIGGPLDDVAIELIVWNRSFSIGIDFFVKKTKYVRSGL